MSNVNKPNNWRLVIAGTLFMVGGSTATVGAVLGMQSYISNPDCRSNVPEQQSQEIVCASAKDLQSQSALAAGAGLVVATGSAVSVGVMVRRRQIDLTDVRFGQGL